jgi:hypothetical protein
MTHLLRWIQLLHGLLCPQHWHLQLVWENPPQSLNSAISVNASGYGTWVECQGFSRSGAGHSMASDGPK